MESSCSIVEDAGPKGYSMKPDNQRATHTNSISNGRAGYTSKGAIPNESFASASSKRKGTGNG